jgi:DUF4097 and DUF4098 domain-containing protein YvlB
VRQGRIQGINGSAALRRLINYSMINRNRTVVGVLLVACFSYAARAENPKVFTYTVGPHAIISVETQYGAVSVRPGNSDQVIVTAFQKSNDVEVDQQQTGNRIAIASHLLRGPDQQSGRIDYQLQVPPDATLNLRSSSGPLSVEHLLGDLTLEGSDAVVNVNSIESAHIHVWTMRGPVSLTDVRNGHVEVSSISGDIRLKAVTGPVVQASSAHGRIFYEGNFGESGEYKLVTHTGDIEALVPTDVSASFRAHSLLGRVQHDFPLQPKHSRFHEEVGRSFIGNSGQASSEVVLRSFSGRIRLKQR